MIKNLVQHRNSLVQCNLYAASAGFPHAVSWQYDKAGHVLLDKATEGTAVASVVGQVVDHRLFCGPSGNFLSREFGSLKKAKLQVFPARPDLLPAFATDFDKVIDELGKIQGQIASFPDRRNLIEMDGQNRNLRFTQNVFVKRPHKIGQTSDIYLEDVDFHKNDENVIEDTVEDETENWPVSDKLRPVFNKIKFEYRSVPLPKFRTVVRSCETETTREYQPTFATVSRNIPF